MLLPILFLFKTKISDYFKYSIFGGNENENHKQNYKQSYESSNRRSSKGSGI